MISRVSAATLYGIDAIKVDVEVDISAGLPSFNIVGLPETSVKESKERVRAAIKNAGFEFPNDRITVNLAPADVRKEGSSFDLPIALGILIATGTIKQPSLHGFLLIGELSLDGTIRSIRGALSVALLAKKEGFVNIVVPAENGPEAAIVRDIRVQGTGHLLELVHFLRGERDLALFQPADTGAEASGRSDGFNFSDIRGQAQAKRALEIAASGAHNVLMLYPVICP